MFGGRLVLRLGSGGRGLASLMAAGGCILLIEKGRKVKKNTIKVKHQDAMLRLLSS